jgi:broad specificity phosphatase PhoE
LVELVYETHSTSVDNELGIATGWLEGELSDAGKRQAGELGARRRADGIAAVYTSDLRRAVQTAQIAFSGTVIPVREDSRLRECNYGDLNGAPVEEITAQRLRRVEQPFPGGESYREVVERTRSFLSDVIAAHDSERILVVAHSANRLALDHLVLGAALEDLVEASFEWRPGWLYVVRANAFNSSSDIE